MKRPVPCAKQQESPSNFTKYCACDAKWFWWLILVSHEASSTMRGATGLTIQHHQILHLPRKMTLIIIIIIDPPQIWNVICNAQSNRTHPPTSPNSAPARKNDAHAWCPSRPVQCAEQPDSPSNITKYCTCHEKWLSSLILLTYETSFTMRGATGINLQPHQILRLPRKTTLMIDARHVWNVIYNAGSHRPHPPTSPNTAPVTKNDSHDWCPSHMKRHLQCAEQQASPPNLTKYYACHTKMHSKIYEKFTKNGWGRHLQCAADSTMIPTMNSSSRTRPFAEVTFRASETHFVLKNTTFRAPAIYPYFTKYAPATKSGLPRSPNAAPATKNNSHHWSSWHIKRHLQCPEQQVSSTNVTKYCACPGKWLASLILMTYQTSFTMRRATGLTLQPHQTLRLPPEMTLMIDARHIWNVILACLVYWWKKANSFSVFYSSIPIIPLTFALGQHFSPHREKFFNHKQPRPPGQMW